METTASAPAEVHEAFEFVEASGGIEAYRLKANDLQLLLLPEAAAPVATLMVTYRVGSRDEVTGLTGATHFLEHLMFKGTERFNKRRGTSVFNVLQRVGARINASTSVDRTNYYELLPKQHLPLAIEIEVCEHDSEASEALRDSAQPAVVGDVAKTLCGVLVEGIGFSAQMGDEEVDVAVVIEIFRGHSHAGLRKTFLVERSAQNQCVVVKTSRAVVGPKNVGALIVSDVQVGITISVEVGGNYTEASRELEGQRRVTEERLRIARDVHDLVAHHIAVINVQSGVAGHVLRSDPDAAETALDAVRDAASTALDELAELLGVLRTAGDLGGPVDPTPDLEAIDDLISSFSASGLRVEHQTSGAPRPLSPSAQIAAYRVVQEALTNAHKHGDGTAAVAQRFDDEALEIVVVNRARSEEASGNGYGLIGMRERLEAVGGELSIDRTDGRFTLRALIPAKGAA